MNQVQKIDYYIKSGTKIASSLLNFYEYVDTLQNASDLSRDIFSANKEKGEDLKEVQNLIFKEGHKEVQQVTYLTLDHVARVLNTDQINYLEKLLRDYPRKKIEGESKYYYSLTDILDCFSLLLPHFS